MDRKRDSKHLLPLASPWSDSNSAVNSATSSREPSISANEVSELKAAVHDSPEERPPSRQSTAETFESAVSASLPGQHEESPLPATPPLPPKPISLLPVVAPLDIKPKSSIVVADAPKQEEAKPEPAKEEPVPANKSTSSLEQDANK